jgi:hypothetical protein
MKQMTTHSKDQFREHHLSPKRNSEPGLSGVEAQLLFITTLQPAGRWAGHESLDFRLTEVRGYWLGHTWPDFCESTFGAWGQAC